jgi:hypothetical protein
MHVDDPPTQSRAAHVVSRAMHHKGAREPLAASGLLEAPAPPRAPPPSLLLPYPCPYCTRGPAGRGSCGLVRIASRRKGPWTLSPQHPPPGLHDDAHVRVRRQLDGRVQHHPRPRCARRCHAFTPRGARGPHPRHPQNRPHPVLRPPCPPARLPRPAPPGYKNGPATRAIRPPPVPPAAAAAAAVAHESVRAGRSLFAGCWSCGRRRCSVWRTWPCTRPPPSTCGPR